MFLNLLARLRYKFFGKYLKDGEYFKQVVRKTAIVLHFTAGYGDAYSVQTLFDTMKGAVATAYAASKDGSILELFAPAYWAYHLGSSLFNEMRTIGIEIVNIGPLWRRGDGKLYDYYGNLYSGDYIRIDTPWRGVMYWAKFTDEQYLNVAKWCAERCLAFNIQPIVNMNNEYVSNNEKLVGVCTHTNFRFDKFDIGPAWEWERFKKLFEAEYTFLVSQSAMKVAA